MDSRCWAVVLGCDVNGLGIIRSLGERNIPVIALDTDPHAIGFYSKYVSERFVCPHPVHSEDGLAELLTDIAKRFSGSKIIFPTKDSFVAAVAKSRDKLGPYYKVPFSGWDVTEYLVDKEKQYKKAAEYGIPLPKTFYPRDERDIEKLLGEIKFPLVLKPVYSEAFYVRYGIKGLKCTSEDDLIERFAGCRSDGFRMIVQEFIEGDASHLYEFLSYVNSAGKMTAMFIVRKVKQYPPEIGIGTHFVSVEEPRLVEEGLRVLEIFSYQGISFMEFKLDERDGSYKLIEINPRTTHYNRLASDCGVDFPRAVYEDVMGGFAGEATHAYAVGKEWIWPENGFLERRRFAIYFKNFLGRTHCTYAIFAWDDPMPEVSFLCWAFRQYVKGFFRKANKVG